MNNNLLKPISAILLFTALTACQPSETPSDTTTASPLIEKYLSQYAPYPMDFDGTTYSDTDKLILQKLVEASEYIDTIYWLQTSVYGIHLRDSLEQIKGDSTASDLLTLLKRNGGPFELLNGYTPFMGTQTYYNGEELYPRGMTDSTFDAYVEKLSPEEKEKFMSPYTLIREDGKGGYTAVPYHEAYSNYIPPIVKLLNEAADLTDNPSFAKFLKLKAAALTTDNYYDADVAWIDMKDSKFDIVFGPFETYADGVKGIKAKYEAYVEIVDQKASADLAKYTSYLKEMENNLPVPSQYKSNTTGITATFVVVNDIIRKGEGQVGYQAVATNLPNDPAVHESKGTKKTFWKNMLAARFNAIIKPVSERLIDSAQLQYLSDEGFFQFVLMHEICHAIGPRTVKMGPDKDKAVNAVIGPNYSPLEEAKADITGLHSLAMLMNMGVVDSTRSKSFYVSYLGSLFRSIRFGLDEAHGKGAAMELSYLKDKGGVTYDENTGRWSVDFDKFEGAVKQLTADFIILEGDGDNTKVQAFFDIWTKETPELARAIQETKDLPVDVLPVRKIKWE